jgi:hypothetical protein
MYQILRVNEVSNVRKREVHCGQLFKISSEDWGLPMFKMGKDTGDLPLYESEQDSVALCSEQKSNIQIL